MEYGKGIHLAQRNTHPLREGVTYERWLLDDIAKQAAAYRRTQAPEEIAANAEQKWRDMIQTPRQRYGMAGVVV